MSPSNMEKMRVDPAAKVYSRHITAGILMLARKSKICISFSEYDFNLNVYFTHIPLKKYTFLPIIHFL